MLLNQGTRTHVVSTATPTRQLLLQRSRIILVICALGGTLFSLLELATGGNLASASVIVKLLGISLCLVSIPITHCRWARQYAWPIAVCVVTGGYTVSALGGVLTAPHEYWTSTVLFVGAALTTAMLLPWGAWFQAGTVLVAVLSLLAAVRWTDGNLRALRVDPAMAVAIGFGFSVVLAGMAERYRRAYRRELWVRRRAEIRVRRSNAVLERRVRERTAALQAANTRLAAESSERQRAFEALRRHQDELAHVLRLHTIGEMAAVLAHEINQPLCAITNYAQGAAQRLRSGAVPAAVLLEAFEQITVEGLRAGDILRGIRNLVRREAGPWTPLDVNALAAEAARVIDPQARARGVTVRLVPAASIPHVCADATQIEQVMVNLILNGVEALADSGNARREVVISTSNGSDQVEVTVSDTGPGIAPGQTEKLFVPFTTTKPRGLGLGLAISRSIVELHNGRLWVVPNQGRGAVFRFSLPTTRDGVPCRSPEAQAVRPAQVLRHNPP